MTQGRAVYTIEVNRGGRREEIDFEGPGGLTDAQITQLADTHLRDARPGQTFSPSVFGGAQQAPPPDPSQVDATPQPPSEWLLQNLGPGAFIAGGSLADGMAGMAQGAGRVLDRAAAGAQGVYNQTLGRAFGQSDSATQTNEAGGGFEGGANRLGQGSALGNTIGRGAAEFLLTRRLPGAFLPGAAAGALGSDADSGWGVARDAAVGGAGGVVGDRLIRGGAALLAPRINSAAQALHNRGVRITPGQAIPSLRSTEERLSSRPFIGDRITEGRRQSYRDFNRAALNEVADAYNSVPGVARVAVPTSGGRGAVRSVGNQLSARYEGLVPRLSLVPDEQLAADIVGVATTTRNGDMVPAAIEQFNTIVERQIMPHLSRGGAPISGAAYRQIERRLGAQIARFSRSENPDHQAMASAFEEMQGAFQGALQRSNPRYSQELAALNSGWANLVRVEGAASGARGGLFSPAQFRQSVRRADGSVRGRAMARGEARMQTLADAADEVLPSNYPDSGTAGRQQMAMHDPRYWTGLAQGAVYTPEVQQLITRMAMAPRPPSAEAVAKLLRALPAPQMGAAGAALVANPIFGPVP